jgi:hypothetical protein
MHRVSVALVAAIGAAALGFALAFALGVRVTRAASPIDGVYRITETFPTFQSVSATPCWPTPMRKALSTDPPTTKTVFYDVQITVAGNKAMFSPPGTTGELFSVPITADPVVPDQLPSYHAQDFHTPSSPSDYKWVDGRFLLHPASGGVDVDLTWQYEDSPDHTGLCQTEINGSLTSAAAPALASPGGIPIDIVIALVGGIAVVTTITIGGWRWRNRKGGPLTPPGDRLAPSVPARCKDVATRHDTELEILNSLHEAHNELREKLEKAETIHRNNIVKAKMVINLEIVQTVGGFTTDLVLALRPSVLRKAIPYGMGENDTWTPPGSISAKLSQQIEQAKELARDLWGKFHQLGNQIEMMKGTVQQAVESFPAVKNAKQMWEFHMNRLGEMIADLPKAAALRTQIAELEPGIASARSIADGTEAAWRTAQRELSDAESAINMARNQLPNKYWVAAKDLENAEKAVASAATRSVDDTVRLTAQTMLEEAKAELAAAERASSDQLKKIADLQTAAAAKKVPVDEAWKLHEAAGKNYDTLVGNRDKIRNVLTTQYSDLTAAAVEQQGKIATQAEREMRQIEEQARQQFGLELAEKEALRERTYNDARASQQLLSNLQIQAERDDSWNRQVGKALGKGIGFVLTPITYPVGLLMEAWQWGFGSSQSPQEIVNFLVRGETNIKILRSYLAALETRIFTQQHLVERLRTQVDACVKGVSVPAIPVGTRPPMPQLPTPPAQPPAAAR